jgi:plasmid stabilization system protein ParE
MNHPLFISREAEADIQEAFQWYESHREGLGKDFLARVEHVFDRISASPEIHAMVYRKVRQTLVRKFPYVVCYVFDRDEVEVIAVFHAHRDPTVWQLRSNN